MIDDWSVGDTSDGTEAAEAVAKLWAARDAASAAEAGVPQPRWFRKSERERALQTLASARQEFRHAFAGIARARVGAVPGRWGLLSDDIESTLSMYVKHGIDQQLRDRLVRIRTELFDARIRAHGGDRSLEEALTRELAQCVNLEPESRNEQARRLIHHLPGSQRPIPEVDMLAVRRALAAREEARFGERYFYYCDPPRFGNQRVITKFVVSFKTADSLELHDIIAAGREEGYKQACAKGLGSAALEHLCRSADHYGLGIVGDIMPGDRTEPSAARLARWYGRNGFIVEPRTPGEFLWATVRRPPRTAHPADS